MPTSLLSSRRIEAAARVSAILVGLIPVPIAERLGELGERLCDVDGAEDRAELDQLLAPRARLHTLEPAGLVRVTGEALRLGPAAAALPNSFTAALRRVHDRLPQPTGQLVLGSAIVESPIMKTVIGSRGPSPSSRGRRRQRATADRVFIRLRWLVWDRSP